MYPTKDIVGKSKLIINTLTWVCCDKYFEIIFTKPIQNYGVLSYYDIVVPEQTYLIVF